MAPEHVENRECDKNCVPLNNVKICLRGTKNYVRGLLVITLTFIAIAAGGTLWSADKALEAKSDLTDYTGEAGIKNERQDTEIEMMKSQQEKLITGNEKILSAIQDLAISFAKHEHQ